MRKVCTFERSTMQMKLCITRAIHMYTYITFITIESIDNIKTTDIVKILLHRFHHLQCEHDDFVCFF